MDGPNSTSIQYQGTPPSAFEILDNDRVVLTGALEIQEEAEERVDARKQLFLASPSGCAARNYKATPPPASNMDKVIALFQTQAEKEDSFNTAFA